MVGPFSRFLSIIVLEAALLCGRTVFAHEAHDRANTAIKSDRSNSEALLKIGAEYRSLIQPIFHESCFDCHSQSPRFPWYHELPIARGFIDQDISEARKHLDFSQGYPFGGHGTPFGDLVAIGKSITENTMPPIRYRILHPSSTISEKRKKVILDWVHRSLEKLSR